VVCYSQGSALRIASGFKQITEIVLGHIGSYTGKFLIHSLHWQCFGYLASQHWLPQHRLINTMLTATFLDP